MSVSVEHDASANVEIQRNSLLPLRHITQTHPFLSQHLEMRAGQLTEKRFQQHEHL